MEDRKTLFNMMPADASATIIIGDQSYKALEAYILLDESSAWIESYQAVLILNEATNRFEVLEVSPFDFPTKVTKAGEMIITFQPVEE